MAIRKAALITGGARGIGFQVAQAFARAGYDLTILARTQKNLDAASEKLTTLGANVLTAAADISDHAAQARAFDSHYQRYSRLDVAVLNAGIFSTEGFLEGAAHDDHWTETISVDLAATIAGVRMAAKKMMIAGEAGGSGRGGVIVNMASAAGVLPLPASPIYCAAKGGLVHFTRAMAWPLAAKGITVAAVCPQFVDTGMVAALKNNPQEAEPVMAPWGVFGLPMLSTDQVVDVVMRVVRAHEAETHEQRLQRRAQLEAGVGCVHLLLQEAGGRVVDPYAGGPTPARVKGLEGVAVP